MTRFVTFLIFITGLVLVMSLSDFKDVSVSHSSFDYEKQKQMHQNRLALIEKLKKRGIKAQEDDQEEEVVEEKPLVELTTAELERGAELYKKCIACHGIRGQGNASQKAPKIGGQHDWYVENQVRDIQDGVRVNQVMMPYVRNLSKQDIKDLATYIQKLPWEEK